MSPSESVRRAAGAAVALMAVFPVTVVILNLVQLGHCNPAADAISLLALGRGGLALNVAFIAGGVAAAPASLFGVAQYAHVATWMSWLLVTMVRARSLAAPHAPAGQELLHPGLSQETTLNTIGDA